MRVQRRKAVFRESQGATTRDIFAVFSPWKLLAKPHIIYLPELLLEKYGFSVSFLSLQTMPDCPILEDSSLSLA
jgi:hypothetical protein